MTNFFYRWTFDLVGNCLPEYRKNGQRIYPVNNAILINDDVGEQIFKIIISCAVRNLKVWKGNQIVFNKGNMEERDVTVGTEVAAEYRPRIGESCKNGYSGAGGNFRHVITSIYNKNGTRNSQYYLVTGSEIDHGNLAVDSMIDVTVPSYTKEGNSCTLNNINVESISVSGDAIQGRSECARRSSGIGGTFISTRGYYVLVSAEIPLCVPNEGYEGGPIIEQQEVWNSLPLEYSDTVGMTAAPPAEVPADTPAAVPGDVSIPGTSQRPLSPGDAAANDNYIIALVEAAKRSGRAVTFGPEGLSSITRQDSKYRIVSPESFSLVMGKWVPDIRYESVRYLSPAAASNFIGRGYELSSVTTDTPESTSKPYSQSVIRRQQQITGKKGIYNKRITRSRITINQAAYGQKPQQSANINKIRGYNRRRIIR